MIFKNKKLLLTSAFLVLYTATVSFATTPTANTLNPDCLPTDPLCIATLPYPAVSTGLTLSSNAITNNLSVGVSGGQTIIGGTAASDGLTISSTSHATKGKIFFGTSAYNEANNRLGIGNSAPTVALDITGALKASTDSTINGISIGRGAGNEATNTVFGASALGFNIAAAGLNNSAFGSSALAINTTGASNTAVGTNALSLNDVGYDNTAVGMNALASNTSATVNVAVGRDALKNNTTAIYNTAIGAYALANNTTGSGNNTGLGAYAMYSNTTGNSNTGVGAYALYSNTTGINNVAAGNNAIYSNTTGTENAAMGDSAMYSNTTGGLNVAFGRYALYTNSTGSNNVALGNRALYSATGANNTAIGYRAGYNLTSGSNNLIIGYNIDAPSASGSNQLSIGNLIFGTGIDGTGTTISTGKIGIANTAPGLLFSVGSSSIANGDQFRIQDANGTCDHNPGSASEVITCTSDGRLKENIQAADPALESLTKFSIKQYDFIADRAHFEYGVIAQDVLSIDPSMVHTREDGFYGVEEVSSWKIVKAIQELDIKIAGISAISSSSNTLRGALISWLGDAQNGIQTIFAKEGRFEEKICLKRGEGFVCITKGQLDTLLAQKAQ